MVFQAPGQILKTRLCCAAVQESIRGLEIYWRGVVRSEIYRVARILEYLGTFEH
jgi:hypothetical protein